MAETFHSLNAALGTTADTAVHTNSTSNKQIIILCQVSNIDGGLLGEDAKTGSWYLAIKEVKDNNPKPSE